VIRFARVYLISYVDKIASSASNNLSSYAGRKKNGRRLSPHFGLRGRGLP